MDKAPWSESELSALRESLRAQMSEKRYAHTVAVEDMVARLCAVYCPEETNLLRAAALLHDLTKELKNGEQLAIFQAHGVTLRPDEQASPKVWHGMTAALEIPARFPDFADPELIKAVRWHSTGHANMTLPEAILLLADYIEEGRSFPDCIALRNRFFKVEPAAMTLPERRRHLRDILLLSFDYTLSELQASGSSVCLDTLAAREDLKNRSEF
jgi:nicotinate-nucleotide adenylyltransferase